MADPTEANTSDVPPSSDDIHLTTDPHLSGDAEARSPPVSEPESQVTQREHDLEGSMPLASTDEQPPAITSSVEPSALSAPEVTPALTPSGQTARSEADTVHDSDAIHDGEVIHDAGPIRDIDAIRDVDAIRGVDDDDAILNADADDEIQSSRKGKQTLTIPMSPITRHGPAGLAMEATSPAASDGPVCMITLLLASGSRHPYKLDERYLLKRNVNVPGTSETGRLDPFSISVYTLKELILREWREEWEIKPSSPSSIRLIHFGKMLDDKEPLRLYHLSADAPNIVHMSVRPQDIADDEEPEGGSEAAGDGQIPDSGSRCCVIL